jgi:hypothetical protein
MVDFDTLVSVVPAVCWRMRHAVKTSVSLWRRFYRHHYGGETRDAAVARMMGRGNEAQHNELNSVDWWRTACVDARTAAMRMREEMASGRMELGEAFAIACSMSWLAVARRMLRSMTKSEINIVLTTRLSVARCSHLTPGGLAWRHRLALNGIGPDGVNGVFPSRWKMNPIVHVSRSGLVESLRFMLGCADRSLLSYYEEDLSATELAIYSGCRESLRLLGPDVNGNVMRSFHDDDPVGIRRHPVVFASGDCLEELFAQMDDTERRRWPKTLQVLRCKQCGTDCASVPAWRYHKCTSGPRQVVFDTGSTGRVFYCRLCPRRETQPRPHLPARDRRARIGRKAALRNRIGHGARIP